MMTEQEILAGLDFTPVVRCDSEKAGDPPHHPAAWFATIHECQLPGAVRLDPLGTYDAALCPACVMKVRAAFTAAVKLEADGGIPLGYRGGVECGVCSRTFTEPEQYIVVTGPIKDPEAGR